jgi:hypothetical protein
MFSAIRKRMRISPATAIASLALVFAMTGGAFAVSSPGGGSSAKPPASTASATAAKVKSRAKPGPRGSAGPKGATGATGAAGPAGTAGPAGPTGPAGSTGATGAKGEKGEPGTPGKNGQEGEEGTPGVAGKEGSPWTDGGTLPSGSTETGAWSATLTPTGEGAVSDVVINSISFPIRLASPIVGFEGSGPSAHYVDAEEQEKGGSQTSECKGSVEKPEAAKGNLCLYEGAVVEPPETKKLTVSIVAPLSGVALPGQISEPAGASTSGALLYVQYRGPAGEARLAGSWAVTAP